MKKIKNAKMFIMGLVIGLLLAGTTVLAASAIASATFNDTRVIFNGEVLELNQPLISVILEGSTNTINYMPVRAVLEAMGYIVDWDGENNAILVSTPQEITPQAGDISLDGFISFRDLASYLEQHGVVVSFGGGLIFQPPERILNAAGQYVLAPGIFFPFPEPTLQNQPFVSVSTDEFPSFGIHSGHSVTFVIQDGFTMLNETEITHALRTVGLIP